MYRRVAIVTDSTACLPAALTDELGITVAQVQVRIGDQLDDESRIPVSTMVNAMRGELSVTTVPPDPGAFYWAYADAGAAGAEAVVSIHVSSRLSGTVDTACNAAKQVRVPVHVVDTGTCGMSLGYAVLAAAEAASHGGDARKVIGAAMHSFRRGTELIYVDTLEYLKRGGRISPAAAMLGTALSMKPLLTMTDGQITPLEKVLGTERALKRMVEIAAKKAGEERVDVAVEHFAAEDRAHDLMRRLRKKIPGARKYMVTQVSSAIGAHVGPGALGVSISPY
ncbi:MAG TPA: DegV family protein [Umezawaea sp.]|nr:DegV family protein [Umezawaea sp.]